MAKKNSEQKLPAYMQDIYGEIYTNLQKCARFDNDFNCRLRTFFQYDNLVDEVLANIKPHERVLQLGIVFGNEIDRIALRIGNYGAYNIVDICGAQIARCEEKYGELFPALKFFLQNAAELSFKQEYDAVICFMLLNELPPATKAKVVNNALQAVREGGKAIFVDYHRPAVGHPLRYFVRMYNRLYHPFAEKLWDLSIDSYATEADAFIWEKKTFFGGMYQFLTATRKKMPTSYETETPAFLSER